MKFEPDNLGKFVNFSNGKSSPERSDDFDNPVFGSNGLIGYAEATNSPANTAVIGRVGSYCGSIHFSKNACWVTDNAIKATAKKPEESRFWYYAMLNRDLHDLRAGSGQPLINQTSLKAVLLPVPEPESRLEIAAVLAALDDKIELNRKTAATLEEMARALYRSWFVDFDPVHAKAGGRAPAHMDTQTAALFPGSFGEDGLPEGWELKRLGDLIKLNYGKALKKDLRIPGEFPVFGSGGVGGTHKEALVKAPTIIVGRKGTVGSLHWAPNGSWPIDTVFYVTSDYPLSLIMRLLGELPLNEMNTDAAVPGLNRDNAYRLEIPFPSAAIVQAYSKLSDEWQQKVDQLEAENQTLATLRDTLLPRLMSGELRVGEVKEQVEDFV